MNEQFSNNLLPRLIAQNLRRNFARVKKGQAMPGLRSREEIEVATVIGIFSKNNSKIVRNDI